MYPLFRLLSQFFDEESVHHLTSSALRYIPQFMFKSVKSQPVSKLGLDFKHPVGLAAGFDKDGCYAKGLKKLGFSFIEFGTVTPKPQLGNPKPRLFRLPKEHALVNQMGFNNQGIDALIDRLKQIKQVQTDNRMIMGISIGPNKTTQPDDLLDDYQYGMQQAFEIADYLAVNVSSPNTPGLREMQQTKQFKKLISFLKDTQKSLEDKHHKATPIVIKLSPDESEDSFKYMMDCVAYHRVEGLILTNTTVSRDKLQSNNQKMLKGGLSGKPLTSKSLACLQMAKRLLGNEVVLIASGGIMTHQDIQMRLASGADLIQLYTGLVYQGSKLIHL